MTNPNAEIPAHLPFVGEIKITPGQLYDNLRLMILGATYQQKIDSARAQIQYARENDHLPAEDLDYLNRIADRRERELIARNEEG